MVRLNANFLIGKHNRDPYLETESTLTAYEETIDSLPKQRQKAIRDLTARQLVTDFPIMSNKTIWSGHGDTLFFDSWSKARFYSNIDTVVSALNKANHYLEKGAVRVPLSDIYNDWSLPVLASTYNSLAFYKEIKYELKLVDEGDYVNHVIFFITRPHRLR